MPRLYGYVESVFPELIRIFCVSTVVEATFPGMIHVPPPVKFKVPRLDGPRKTPSIVFDVALSNVVVPLLHWNVPPKFVRLPEIVRLSVGRLTTGERL